MLKTSIGLLAIQRDPPCRRKKVQTLHVHPRGENHMSLGYFAKRKYNRRQLTFGVQMNGKAQKNVLIMCSLN